MPEPLAETTYRVNNLYTAIQGEGSLTGTPMLLLRLHGCSVGCAYCDTKHTWNVDSESKRDNLLNVLGDNPLYVDISTTEILARIATQQGGFRWILVTGGEPAEQDLRPLVAALHAAGYRVAIETSGTADGLLGADFDWVCVSPKIDMPGKKTVLPQVLAVADEIKYVVGKPADLKTLEDLVSTHPLKPEVTISVQPMSLSPKATALCIQAAMEKGWRLSLQTHRMLDLP